MRHVRSFVLLGSALLVSGAAAFACSSDDKNETTSSADGGSDAGGGAVLPPPSTPAPPGPAGTGLDTGLPCDVQAVLENRCIACHDGVTQFALVDYDTLVGPSKTDPSKTMAQLSLERMKSTTSPMPPPPAEPPAADEIQVFEDWVNAGTPKGAQCTDAPPDGGSMPDASPTELGDGGCTSKMTWDGGNTPSPLMRPGEACNACHQKLGGPNLRAAGTVYASYHEPNDCNGKAPPPPLKVIVTDSHNNKVSMDVNAAGNFYTKTRLFAPYRAEVTDGTNTRKMMGSVTSGDCNSCHTEQGANNAPGRILAP
jgi:hypothetical protein